MELVKNIHEALHENWNKPFPHVTVKSDIVAAALRTGSGNISVKPHNLSKNVSSGSYNQKGYLKFTKSLSKNSISKVMSFSHYDFFINHVIFFF